MTNKYENSPNLNNAFMFHAYKYYLALYMKSLNFMQTSFSSADALELHDFNIRSSVLCNTLIDVNTLSF